MIFEVNGLLQSDSISFYSEQNCAGDSIPIVEGALLGGKKEVLLAEDVSLENNFFYFKISNSVSSDERCLEESINYLLRKTPEEDSITLVTNNPAPFYDKERRPSVRVSNLSDGDNLSLFKRGGCSLSDRIGRAKVSHGEGTVRAAENLPFGITSLFVQTSLRSQKSECINIGVFYDLRDVPETPEITSFVRIGGTTPGIKVNNVSPGDRVILYKNECLESQILGQAVVRGNNSFVVVNVEAGKLTPGIRLENGDISPESQFIFYATRTPQGSSKPSACTQGHQYTVNPTSNIAFLSANSSFSITPVVEVREVDADKLFVYQGSPCQQDKLIGEASPSSPGSVMINLTFTESNRGNTFNLYLVPEKNGTKQCNGLASFSSYKIRRFPELALTQGEETPSANNRPRLLIRNTQKGDSVSLYLSEDCSGQSILGNFF